MSGATRKDAGKPSLLLLPTQVLSYYARNEDCRNMAVALAYWYRRQMGTCQLLQTLTPELVRGAHEVLKFGVGKYAAFNWEQGLHFSRIIDPGLRHATTLVYPDVNCGESGLPHAAHAACNVIFAAHHDQMFADSEFDDRPPAEAGK